jgi:hypothetical protein
MVTWNVDILMPSDRTRQRRETFAQEMTAVGNSIFTGKNLLRSDAMKPAAAGIRRNLKLCTSDLITGDLISHLETSPTRPQQ